MITLVQRLKHRRRHLHSCDVCDAFIRTVSLTYLFRIVTMRVMMANKSWSVCPSASGHRGCVYRGASVLQQPCGHCEPEGPEEAQGLSLQKGNGDLQLLLFQHHPGCQAQQTGRRTRAEWRKKTSVELHRHKRSRPGLVSARLWQWCCCLALPLQRLIVCLEESLYIHNIRDMKVLHTIRETPPNPSGECRQRQASFSTSSSAVCVHWNSGHLM